MATVEPGTGDVPVIEDEIYDVTCLDAEVLEMADKFAGGAIRKKLKVYLQVHGTDDGEGNEIVLDPLMNLKWSAGGDYPASSLYLYAVALCGPQDGELPFETDNLKGKHGRALIQTPKEGAWPKVAKIMPAKKGQDVAGLPPSPPPLLNADGSVNFTTFWAEAARRRITQAMVKAQLETADLNELERLPPLDVLELLQILSEPAAI